MNMNNTKLTKIILATVALGGLCFLGLTHLHDDFLPMVGVVVSYMAALVILGLAALDNRSAKRLS